MTDALDWLRSEMEDARERCEAATEGPWKMGGEPEAWTPVAPDGTELVTCCCCGGFRGRRDVRFTVEARTDLPAALSVLDRVGEALVKADFLDMNNLTTEEKNIISALRDAHRERQDTASQKDTP